MGAQPDSVVVVAGGGEVAPAVLAHLPAGAPVVAADSGLDAALALGLRVDVVVGDLDSVTPAALAAAEAAGARVERHPVDKDATDLALALTTASSLLGADGGEIVVLAVEGGRLDHLLAGVLALADAAHAGRRIRAHLGTATLHVLHGPGEVAQLGPPGAVVTLVPVGGPAVGVRTEGLRYPLRGERLPAGTTRGVSNVVDVAPALVGLDAGTLLVVLPGGAPDRPPTE
jgi:thiamine pyrophosphokinase